MVEIVNQQGISLQMAEKVNQLGTYFSTNGRDCQTRLSLQMVEIVNQPGLSLQTWQVTEVFN